MALIDTQTWVDLVLTVLGAIAGWLARHFGLGAPKGN